MSEDLTQKLGDIAAAAGIRRVHFLAWRDLDDVEAGGSEIHAAAIAKLWAAAGIEVTMRTSYAFGEAVDVERDGYRVIRKAGRYLVFPRSIIAELAGWHGPRPDAVVEYWNGVPFLSPVWHRGPRLVFIHHLHRDMWRMVLPASERLARLGDVLERRIAPPFYRSSPIVTLCESSRQELIAHQGFQPNQVIAVPPGIDQRFSPGGRSSRHPLVVAVGRLMPPKRFDAVIRAAARARSEAVPDLELVIAGEGRERKALESLVAELGAEDWIQLPGRIDDAEIIELYRRAWVVTSASMAEGWGMTLTEAAACGTPVVASDIPGHRDSVAVGASGLLAADDGELSDHLVAVLTDRALRQRLQHGALAHAATLTWDATAIAALRVLADDATRRR